MNAKISQNLRGITLSLALSCTSCTSMHGAWYYQSEDPAAENQRQPGTPDAEGDKAMSSVSCSDRALYFAMVNDKDQPLKKVTVFINVSAIPAKSEPSVVKQVGWECGVIDRIEPGQLLVLALPMKGDAQCAIPLRATLLADGREEKIRVSGSMPSALPTAWQGCPHPAKVPICKPASELCQVISNDSATASRAKQMQ